MMRTNEVSRHRRSKGRNSEGAEGINMYSCPACNAEDTAQRTTCRCGADLTLLLRLDAVADAWFNRALEALAQGAPGRALEWLSACCAARPTDAAARRAQARVWAQLGRIDEARDALDRAAELDPTAPELIVIREALEAANVSSAARRSTKKKLKKVARARRALRS